ncbi:MAG: MBOAT family O-acyltransferase [Bacteroidota bacterium]|nr:MBOAT family O-acyltransferase [Bacteroidota bacterium]
MVFNSIDFVIFLSIVFVVYWYFTNQNLRLQNLFLLTVGYVFYGWWDWRFLIFIMFSTLVDYTAGRLLKNQENATKRKLLLYMSLITNIGMLCYFKYYNFFIENFVEAFSFFGRKPNITTLNIILPVGISFYTFQTLSYTIDVYQRKLEPSRDIVAFASYVSFFPQLVAGPIERAKSLLPQFYKKRIFDYSKAVDGMRQILWGLFKKIVIADNCVQYVDVIFDNSSLYSGSVLVLGALLFAFQIYGDFSGYSDIAIGISRLLGFNLTRNFHFPYFSRDVAEFWRRWHISLSTWFRDYLYIPLGGSRGGIMIKIRNTFIIFIVSGFWHGANWTFILWGVLNAIYFLPLLILNKNRINIGVVAEGKIFPNLRETLQMFFTFGLIVLAWIFFRADNIGHAFIYISNIFSPSLFTFPELSHFPKIDRQIIILVIFIVTEWNGRANEFALQTLGLKWKSIYRYLLYMLIILCLFYFGGEEKQFIYFQF